MTAALAGVVLALCAVTAPPGGPGAWSVGGALLADPPGALAVFDQPARLLPGGQRGGFAVARARLYELDALARTRVAASARLGAATLALGAESFGPPGYRAQRMTLGLARAGAGVELGAAASAWRLGEGGVARHGASLDAGAAARLPAAGGRLSAAWAGRSIIAGGDPAAVADPDWTAELALDLGAARAHVARTRDLGGARTGAGVSVLAAGVRVSAGVLGPPVQWALGIGLARAGSVRAALARVEHPDLGASDAIEGGVSW